MSAAILGDFARYIAALIQIDRFSPTDGFNPFLWGRPLGGR